MKKVIKRDEQGFPLEIYEIPIKGGEGSGNHDHGGRPGEEGYWLMWVAVGDFAAGSRKVSPGVDYEFSRMDAPRATGAVPKPTFAAPGARKMSRDEIAELFAFFNDNPLTGGQAAPRRYKWVNDNVAVFVQFDRNSAAEATELRYVGISVLGEYCADKRPTPDFSHFHRTEAPSYGQGHGGPAGTRGSWLLWVPTGDFNIGSRRVTPGVDRESSRMDAPSCP